MNDKEQFNDEMMHKVWEYEQSILDVVHKVCVDHNLRYTLFFGTLLGAVRHGGFIPWDDDIDIVMPREDYEKFLRIWKKQNIKGYILQNKRTDADTFNNFSKIRKDNTTFLQFEVERNVNYHKGIFIDIFPADRAARGIISSKMQLLFWAMNLLYSRGYTSGSKGLIGLAEKILLSTNEKKYVKRYIFTEKMASKWNKNHRLPYMCSGTLSDCRLRFSPRMFDKLGTISFNGKRYMSVRNPEKYLKMIYGDFMQLPPEEQRVWFHHPLLIDFDKNYEDIVMEKRK